MQTTRNLSYPFLLALAFCFSAYAASYGALYALAPASQVSPRAKKSEEKKKLVKVVVMNFVDEKGQKDYKYLAPSISEAVDKSLRKRFVYLTTPSRTNEQDLKTILQKQRKKGRKKDTGLHHSNDTNDLKNGIKTLAQKNDLDVVILGSYYTYEKAGDETIQIIIKPELYLSFFGEFITLEEVSNPIDSTIFNVTERVANILVDQISTLIGFQQTLGLTVIAPEYTKASQEEGITKSQRAKEQREQTILDRETERLKGYLNSIFEGGIFELSEYVESNAKAKPPKTNSKKDLLNWQSKHKIDNLLRVRLNGDKLVITLEQKGKPSFSVNYSPLFLMDADIENAFSELGSVLRDRSGVRHPLYEKSFTRSWNAVYLETGLSGGAGFTFFPDTSPLSIQARAFVRLSPGRLSEKYNLDFLRDFTHPILRPLVFDFSFGFVHTASEGKFSDDLGGVWSNDFSLQFYSFSLGAGYSYTFLRRMRFMAGVAFAWYLSPAQANLAESTIEFEQTTGRFVYAPALLANTALHYLLFSHLSLGVRMEYRNYFGNSLSGSGSNISQIGLLLEAAYVF